MSNRKPIPPSVLRDVLVASRRRCCVCFGVNRDTSLRQGQIAHLDQDSSNPNVKNLAFMCFDHHDQYDSKTRQSKNFTQQEVIAYRDELYEAVRKGFSKPVQFGAVTDEPMDPIAGTYIRTSDFDSAEIVVARMGKASNEFAVSGLALWGTHREFGPNIGQLSFFGPLVSGAIAFSERMYNGEDYRVTLLFGINGLEVVEVNWVGVHGMNVTFEGFYQRQE